MILGCKLRGFFICGKFLGRLPEAVLWRLPLPCPSPPILGWGGCIRCAQPFMCSPPPFVLSFRLPVPVGLRAAIDGVHPGWTLRCQRDRQAFRLHLPGETRLQMILAR